MELKVVKIEKPDDVNIILGQAHFIKTVEDLHEAMVNGVPGAKFGLAFCESSGPALVRWSGTDPELVELAQKNALALSCGHVFLILMRGMYPINVLNAIKMVPEVCRIFCATANPVEVIVAETEHGPRRPRRCRRSENEGRRGRKGAGGAQSLPSAHRLQARLSSF
jgi:adenosine/AMP kinase